MYIQIDLSFYFFNIYIILFGKANFNILCPLCIQTLKYITSKIPTAHLDIYSNVYLVNILYAMWLLLIMTRGDCPSFADVEITRKLDRPFRVKQQIGSDPHVHFLVLKCGTKTALKGGCLLHLAPYGRAENPKPRIMFSQNSQPGPMCTGF